MSVPTGDAFIDIASIKEGETILHLGCGNGTEVFLAEKRTGPKGQVIGVDASMDTISLARRAAAENNLRPQHVAFVQALPTEDVPILADSIDCVLSSWSISALPQPGSERLYSEIYRVLKPGGRVVLRDTTALHPIPDSLRSKLVADVVYTSGLDGHQELAHSSSVVDALNGKPGSIDANHSAAVHDTVYYCFHAVKPPRTDVDKNPPETALREWWVAHPPASSEVPYVDCDDVATLIKNPSGQDYAVIDVRRNDHAGGHVRGSTQFPAQTFYNELPAIFQAVGDRKQVIFYCGSSNGRGPRYQDYLNDIGDTHSKALIMTGGFKEWAKRFSSDEHLVDRDPE
ncbi:hypothetical protein ID866_5928 [Astraeus odoratus]|nr:hypothetical protein ID866_5928 [Astraeus odoratus]